MLDHDSYESNKIIDYWFPILFIFLYLWNSMTKSVDTTPINIDLTLKRPFQSFNAHTYIFYIYLCNFYISHHAYQAFNVFQPDQMVRICWSLFFTDITFWIIEYLPILFYCLNYLPVYLHRQKIPTFIKFWSNSLSLNTYKLTFLKNI